MKKIVVAEDDTANRDLISEMLRGWGYDVVEARDGADALEKVEQSNPDLVLCDIQMPVLDGVGLVQALRRNHNFATLPVIALTGFGLQDHRDARSVPGAALPGPDARRCHEQSADGPVSRCLSPADGPGDGAPAAEGG